MYKHINSTVAVKPKAVAIIDEYDSDSSFKDAMFESAAEDTVIHATTLDSRDVSLTKYPDLETNLEAIGELASVSFDIDATLP